METKNLVYELAMKAKARSDQETLESIERQKKRERERKQKLIERFENSIVFKTLKDVQWDYTYDNDIFYALDPINKIGFAVDLSNDSIMSLKQFGAYQAFINKYSHIKDIESLEDAIYSQLMSNGTLNVL